MIRCDLIFRFAVVAILVGIGTWLRSEPQAPSIKASVAPQSAVAQILKGETVAAALKTPATVSAGLGNRQVNELRQGSSTASAKPAP